MENHFQKFISSLKVDANDRASTINLNASENITSKAVKGILGTHPAYDCYHLSPPGGSEDDHWSFIETSFMDKIRTHIENLGKELFGTARIDPRPKGGQAAEIAVLLGIAKRGDLVFYVDEHDGGHFGLSQMAEVAGIRLEPIVFHHTSHLIDIESTINRMRDIAGAQRYGGYRNKPKALVISQSFVLRKQPIRDLCTRVKEEFPEIIITWDSSHTLGLVLGREYPHPLENGVDVLHANTHKTFPGPQKAVLAYSEDLPKEIIESIGFTICPILQSNCGTGEIFSLAVAFEEMRRHGREYAKQVCKNAKALAQNLKKQGFSVVGESFGFTETHQVWTTVTDKETAIKSYKHLHSAGIRVNPVMLPFTGGCWGIRMGTPSLTRRGLKETDMKEIARFLRKVLIDRVKPSTIRKETREFMSAFPISELEYVLDTDEMSEILAC